MCALEIIDRGIAHQFLLQVSMVFFVASQLPNRMHSAKWNSVTLPAESKETLVATHNAIAGTPFAI